MSHPVLLVGVGGAGLNTLVAFNRQLMADPVMRPRLADEIYYLAVDTDRSALDIFMKSVAQDAGAGPQPFVGLVDLSQGLNTIYEIVRPAFMSPFFEKPDDPGLARLREHWWFDANNNPFYGPRPCLPNTIHPLSAVEGYGLAWYGLHRIEQCVGRNVDCMIKSSGGGLDLLRNMDVFVVAGLAGGTGRGAWAPIALKIREYLLDNYGIHVSPTGIFFDATVFDCVARDCPEQRLAFEVNSATGLSELSCWMRNYTFRPEEQFEFRLPDMASPGCREKDVLKVDLELNPYSGAPVSSAYLICGRNRQAILDNNRQYHEMAGAAIYAMIAHPEISARSINDIDTFKSLGACTFEVDALHIRAYCETRARGMVLGSLAAGADDVSAPVSAFFADHPLNAVVRTAADLKPNAEGTLYQRVVAALLSRRRYKSAFAVAVEKLDGWTLSDAEQAILPLLRPAPAAEVQEAVQQALKGFGKKDDAGVPLGLDGKKGEAAIMDAVKEVFCGSAGQTPSVGRALEFLKAIWAGIAAAQGGAPAALPMSAEATSEIMDPAEAVATTLKIFSKRTFIETMKGGGSFNEYEISALVRAEGVGLYWGIVPQGVAAANYPAINAALAEAFAPAVAKIAKLVAACERFVDCCLEARAAFALEAPIVADGEIGDDAFSKLFSTPGNIDETLYDANDRACFSRRILRPIVESREELDKFVRDSIRVEDGMGEFVSRVIDDGTLERLGSDMDHDLHARRRFVEGLMDATRGNVSLSENFLLEHFTFEKVLERNREYWDMIVENQRDPARRRELYLKFHKTLGVEPRINPRNLMMPPGLPEIEELRRSIAASLASTCTPWWIAETRDYHHSVMLFVPFHTNHLIETRIGAYIAKEVPHTAVQVIGLDDSKGGVSPFSYVAFSSEGIGLSEAEMKTGTHLLDKIRSLDYWKRSDVLDCLRLTERPDGKSLFAPEGMHHPFGYVSPWFVHNPTVSAMRWKPWAQETEFPPVPRKREVRPAGTSPIGPDVFISYRRATGLETARTLQLALETHGFSVFLDYDSLQDGEFNQAIYKAIENCKVVVALLSTGSLDRCASEDDWVRKELEHAFRAEKKIVPIAASDVYNRWRWPESLPESLSALADINISELHTGALFKESVDKIIKTRFGFTPGQS